MTYTESKVKEKYIPKSTRLLDQVRETLRYHHYAIRTEKPISNGLFISSSLTGPDILS